VTPVGDQPLIQPVSHTSHDMRISQAYQRQKDRATVQFEVWALGILSGDGYGHGRVVPVQRGYA